jgi:hypothetical protein
MSIKLITQNLEEPIEAFKDRVHGELKQELPSKSLFFY